MHSMANCFGFGLAMSLILGCAVESLPISDGPYEEPIESTLRIGEQRQTVDEKLREIGGVHLPNEVSDASPGGSGELWEFTRHRCYLMVTFDERNAVTRMRFSNDMASDLASRSWMGVARITFLPNQSVTYEFARE